MYKKLPGQEVLEILKGSYTGNVDYEEYYKIHNGDIRHVQFKNIILDELLVLYNTEYNHAIVFKECVFEKSIEFGDSTFNYHVSFQNCVFNNDITFYEPTFNGLRISNCIVHNSVSIEGGTFNNDFNISVHGENGDPSVFLHSGYFNKLSISSGLNDTQLEQIDIMTINVTGKIFINGSEQLDGKLTGKKSYKTRVKKLYIRNLSENLILYFENIHVNKVSIASFTNSVKFKMHNIHLYPIDGEISEFTIQNSNLGNAELSTIDLSKFDVVNIRDSYISDTNFVNTIWHDNITSYDQNGSVIIREIDNYEEYYFKNRDVYRQLKYASNKYGDTVSAFEFLAKEMEAYRKQLFQFDVKFEFQRKFLLPKNWSKIITLNKGWWNNKSERLNLWLSMSSNYYGNNWLKATGLTLLINLILFTFYCSSRSIYPNPFGLENWRRFGAVLPYYFEFLNPLHKPDFFSHIKSGEPNSGALLIDYLSRIVIAYLVYQLITAFRKFGRKSA